MKKKIALTLAAVMTIASVAPMNLFAASASAVTNTISNYGEYTILPPTTVAGATTLGGLGTGTDSAGFKGIANNGVGSNLVVTFGVSEPMGIVERSFLVTLSEAKWAFRTEVTPSVGAPYFFGTANDTLGTWLQATQTETVTNSALTKKVEKFRTDNTATSAAITAATQITNHGKALTEFGKVAADITANIGNTAALNAGYVDATVKGVVTNSAAVAAAITAFQTGGTDAQWTALVAAYKTALKDETLVGGPAEIGVSATAVAANYNTAIDAAVDNFFVAPAKTATTAGDAKTALDTAFNAVLTKIRALGDLATTVSTTESLPTVGMYNALGAMGTTLASVIAASAAVSYDGSLGPVVPGDPMDTSGQYSTAGVGGADDIAAMFVTSGKAYPYKAAVISDTQLLVTYTGNVNAATDALVIPLVVTTNGDKAVKVSVVKTTAVGVNEGEYTLGRGSVVGTVGITAGDMGYGDREIALPKISFTEATGSIGTIRSGSIVITAPADFKFVASAGTTAAGTLAAQNSFLLPLTSGTTGTLSDNDTKITYNITVTPSTQLASGLDLTGVKIVPVDPTITTTYDKPLKITVAKESTTKVTGGTAVELTVAQRSQLGLSRKAITEVPKVYAGKLEQSGAKIEITENAPGSLLANREITFTVVDKDGNDLSSNVRISGATFFKNASLTAPGYGYTDDTWYYQNFTSSAYASNIYWGENGKYLALYGYGGNNSGKATLAITPAFSVDADFAGGEIYIKIGGSGVSGMADTLVKVADVVNPITTTISPIAFDKSGTKTVDITITEADKKVLKSAATDDVILYFAKKGTTIPTTDVVFAPSAILATSSNSGISKVLAYYSSVNSAIPTTVAQGNLIPGMPTSFGALILNLDGESTAATTISLKDVAVTVTANTTVASQEYDLIVYPRGVLDNAGIFNGSTVGLNTTTRGFATLGYAVADAAVYGNPSSTAALETKIVINTTTNVATINGREVNIDAALAAAGTPNAPKDAVLVGNDLYIPMRYIGTLLGLNINWNDITRSCTFQSDALGLVITVDSSNYTLQRAGQFFPVESQFKNAEGKLVTPMTTIKGHEGSLYLPLRAFCVAFGYDTSKITYVDGVLTIDGTK